MRSIALSLVIAFWVEGPAFAAATQCPADVFLISGAVSTDNHCDYYENIDRASEAMSGVPLECQVVFSGDGPKGHDAQLAEVRKNASRVNDPNCMLGPNGSMPPSSPNPTTFSEGRKPDEAANLASIQARMKDTCKSGTLFFYVTNHGGTDRSKVTQESSAVLWNGSWLKASDLKKMIRELPQSCKVIMAFDQCFGGGMLESAFDDFLEPRPNTCGFAAATGGELAFSGGGFMKAAERVHSEPNKRQWDRDGNGKYSFGEVYQEMLVADRTFSTPVSTSDLYLEHYYLSHPAGSGAKTASQILTGCIDFSRLPISVINNLEPGQAALLRLKVEDQRKELTSCLKDLGADASLSIDELEKRADGNELLVRTYEKGMVDSEQKEAKLKNDLASSLYDAGCPYVSASGQIAYHCKSPNGTANSTLYYESQNSAQKLGDYLANKQGYCASNPGYGCCSGAKATEGSLTFDCTEVGKGMASDMHSRKAKEYKDQVTRVGKITPAMTSSGGGSLGIPPEYNTTVSEVAKAVRAKESGNKRWTQANMNATKLRRCAKAAYSLEAMGAMLNRGDAAAISQTLNLLACENTPMSFAK